MGRGGEGSSENVEFDEFSAIFTVELDFGDDVLFMLGLSEIDVNGEGFEGLSVPLDEITTDNVAVKLCVVSLRMAPKTIPTMSEWGLITFAAFVGIAGIWFLRRRKVTA